MRIRVPAWYGDESLDRSTQVKLIAMIPVRNRTHSLARLIADLDGTENACTRATIHLMDCRPGCGACCIAPSISSAVPGMPLGKPAGVRCAQLDEGNRCRLFASPERPSVCSSLTPTRAMCGDTAAQALAWLHRLETETAPGHATGR